MAFFAMNNYTESLKTVTCSCLLHWKCTFLRYRWRQDFLFFLKAWMVLQWHRVMMIMMMMMHLRYLDATIYLFFLPLLSDRFELLTYTFIFHACMCACHLERICVALKTANTWKDNVHNTGTQIVCLYAIAWGKDAPYSSGSIIEST